LAPGIGGAALLAAAAAFAWTGALGVETGAAIVGGADGLVAPGRAFAAGRFALRAWTRSAESRERDQPDPPPFLLEPLWALSLPWAYVAAVDSTLITVS
jgi:hypothetical protein